MNDMKDGGCPAAGGQVYTNIDALLARCTEPMARSRTQLCLDDKNDYV